MYSFDPDMAAAQNGDKSSLCVVFSGEAAARQKAVNAFVMSIVDSNLIDSHAEVVTLSLHDDFFGASEEKTNTLIVNAFKKAVGGILIIDGVSGQTPSIINDMARDACIAKNCAVVLGGNEENVGQFLQKSPGVTGRFSYLDLSGF